MPAAASLSSFAALRRAAGALLCGMLSFCQTKPAAAQSPGGSFSLMPQDSAAVQAAFVAACREGNREAAARALALGADPDDAAAPLTLAAERNDAELVALLITYGADASRAAGALPAAVRHQNAAIASALLDAGADPNRADGKGLTPLKAALTGGAFAIARLMFRHGGQPDEFIEPALQHDDTALLTALLQYGIPADYTDSTGNPLLVRAAVDNKPELAAFLLKAGADHSKTGGDGLTALQVAAIAKHEALLRVLLEGGCDPNVPIAHPVKPEVIERVDDDRFRKWLRRDSGLTPLMLAAARGDTATIALLLEKGARRGQQSRGWKRYPVVFACEAEHIAAAQLLLGRKPAPDEPVHRVTIHLSTQRAVLYRNDEPIRSCRVSTGRKGYATPTGRFVITDKQKSWISTIYKVSMPYFMRLSCRDIGLHAGVCPGYPASHGCIRMPHSDVRHLFGVLKIGDAVTIEQ